jgi:hypothetical protein
MNSPETRHSLFIRVRDPSDHDAWTEFAAIYRPPDKQLEKLKATANREAETTESPFQFEQPPGDTEAGLQHAAECSRNEAERRLSETELKQAESAPDPVAADYRDEAAKKRPVRGNLNRLK